MVPKLVFFSVFCMWSMYFSYVFDDVHKNACLPVLI